MKYKLADLMPVKANDFIASVNENLWYWTLNVRTKTSHGVAVDNFPFLSMTEWIIPVPGAPEEVRPRKYPDEKPKRKGKYIAHDKINDKWFVNDWRGALPSGDDYFSWREVVDYFINIPLEEEMESRLPNIIWKSENLLVAYRDNRKKLLMKDTKFLFNDPDTIGTEFEDMTGFAKHWLELQAYESIIEGFNVLAALAEQKGPGQAAIYRIKLDGYERYAAQLRRSLVELEHILA